MPYAGDVKMPCGRVYYCGRTACRHAGLCAVLREGMQYRRGPHEKAAGAARGQAPVRPPLAQPADVVYLYDGSLTGFYCCVHESVYCREIPGAIWREEDAQPSLYAQKRIESDEGKARRVRRSVPAKISPQALALVEGTMLTCLWQKELAMLRFLLLGYRWGSRVATLFGHEEVQPVLDAVKHLGSEAHLLKGFVRFSDYGGVLAASISPKNFVLPYLQPHFVMRYPSEDFMIYDKTHKAALVYENRKARIIPLQGMAFPEADENEEKYRALWKRFYNTVAIEARENPRCRMTHMPKRYWENMLEVQDLLQPAAKPYVGGET